MSKEKIIINPNFIVKIDRKDFITYHGLLDAGHQIGIKSIDVNILQIPDAANENTAICKARVTSNGENSFSDIGDANPNNCNRMIAKHIIRMASTRAIARALRSMTNVGMACYEELDLIKENNSENNKVCIKNILETGIKANSYEKNTIENKSPKKTKKGSVTGPPPEERFKKALIAFEEKYSIKMNHIFQYIGKVPFDDITEEDIVKIGQLWNNIEIGSVNPEDIKNEK